MSQWFPNAQPPSGDPWWRHHYRPTTPVFDNTSVVQAEKKGCSYCAVDDHESEDCEAWEAQPPPGHPYWKKLDAAQAKAAQSAVTCYSCNEKGHYAPECPKKRKRPAQKVCCLII